MFKALLTFILIFAIPAPCFATFNFDAAGGYLYSSLQYDSGSSFSLVSTAGTTGRLDMSYGGSRWDILLDGQWNRSNFKAPSSKTIAFPNLQTTTYGAGIRLRTQAVWMHLSYESKDALYLETTGATTYNLRKSPVGFGTLGFKLFGSGHGYQIGTDADISLPVSSPTTLAGQMKYGYIGRGIVHIEVGKNFRFGVQAGIESHQYKVLTDTYYRSEFCAGISIGIGGVGKSSGSSTNDYDSGYIPNYPL